MTQTASPHPASSAPQSPRRRKTPHLPPPAGDAHAPQPQPSAPAGTADLERAFDTVPGILIVLSASGRIQHWNASARRTFGLPFDTVRGKPLSSCGIGWVDPPEIIDACFAPGEPDRRSEHAFLTPLGKRWLGITLHTVQHAAGSHGFLLSGADITDRRAAEEQSRQTHKLEAIGQLAAGIAHEINTPTQYVGDNIVFLRDAWADLQRVFACAAALRAAVGAHGTGDQFDAAANRADLAFVLTEFPRALDQALEGTQRIAHIVRAMKEFSHPGSVEKTELDLNRAVENTVLIACNEWKYVAQLHTDLDPALPPVHCYPGEIGQVILNLLVNAAHAIQDRLQQESSTGPGRITAPGRITITTRSAGQAVEVLVTDTGTGIPEAIRARIFELFFTTKEVGKGTGQGLAFAHSVIVKKHGGHLWVDSEVGQGSTFGVRLPITA